MSRYKNTRVKRKNKKNYFATTIYKKVEEQNSDLYFIAQEGDRCDVLANRFYGDSTLWWFIARAVINWIVKRIIDHYLDQ